MLVNIFYLYLHNKYKDTLPFYFKNLCKLNNVMSLFTTMLFNSFCKMFLLGFNLYFKLTYFCS